MAWMSAAIMAGGSLLGGLMNSSNPPNVNTSGTQSTTLPSWYTSYLQGALGTGEALASNPYPQYTGQRLAGFNDTQQTAFNDINNAQGNWSPLLQASANTASGVAGNAQGAGSLANMYGAGAVGAASQPVQNWTQPGVAQSWMSPYMGAVTNAIAQQGNQNFYTNLMPGINAQFIAAGDPNSSANAAGLSLGASQEQANISAQQAQALEQGYGTAMSGQQTAAGQQLQQQGLAANTGLGAASTALGGGNLSTTAGLGAASALQGNAGALQSMGYNDISQLLAAGNQQQTLEQTGYNTAYQNFMNQVNWPMQQMSWLNSLATGASLPTSTSASGSAPLAGATYGPGLAAYGLAGYTAYNAANPSGGNTTPYYMSNPTTTTNSGYTGNTDLPAGTQATINSYATPYKRGGLYQGSLDSIRASRKSPHRMSPLNQVASEELHAAA